MITLIGMPGSGKSSAGRLVARHFSLPFVDSDQEIEQALGMSIKDFFAREGEAAFRDCESATLAYLAERSPDCVLSTGGGAVLRAENRVLLRRAGTVVYLRASADELYRRLRHDTRRPLLQTADPRARLAELFAQRDALYRETAHYAIDAGRGTVHALVRALVMQIELAGIARAPGS